MKIVIVSANIAVRGGAELVARNAVISLLKAGQEVVLIHGDPLYASQAIDGLRDHYLNGLNTSLTQSDGTSTGISEVIQKEKPDLVDFHIVAPFGDPETIVQIAEIVPVTFTVHTHCLTCPGYFRLLKVDDKICEHSFSPLCFWFAYNQECSFADRKSLSRWIRVWRSRLIARKVTRLIVLSSYMADTLVKAGFQRSHISVVSPLISRNISNKLPKTNSDGTILFAGRISEEKGIELLFRASRYITAKHRIVVAGDGPVLPKLKQLAKENQIHADYVGWVQHSKLADLFDKAAVFVLPSRCAETFGLVGLEATSFGLPVVAFDTGGVSSWLQDGVNGFLVQPFNVVEMAEKIDMVLKNRELAKRMKKAGKRIAETKYNSSIHFENLMTAYEEAEKFFHNRVVESLIN